MGFLAIQASQGGRSFTFKTHILIFFFQVGWQWGGTFGLSMIVLLVNQDKCIKNLSISPFVIL